MPLTVGTNSYISVADTDVYFSESLNTGVWTTASNEKKEAALIQATRTIDACYIFNGHLSDDEQLLAFPRSDVTDCEGRDIDSDSIPISLKNATCEQSLHLLSGNQLVMPSLLTQGFKKAKLGSMEVEVTDSKSTASPDKISSMARAFLDCLGTIKSSAVSGGGFTGSTIRG